MEGIDSMFLTRTPNKGKSEKLLTFLAGDGLQSESVLILGTISTSLTSTFLDLNREKGRMICLGSKSELLTVTPTE